MHNYNNYNHSMGQFTPVASLYQETSISQVKLVSMEGSVSCLKDYNSTVVNTNLVMCIVQVQTEVQYNRNIAGADRSWGILPSLFIRLAGGLWGLFQKDGTFTNEKTGKATVISVTEGPYDHSKEFKDQQSLEDI